MTCVFIPTTQQPVEIISLTEEHTDIQSVICITNTFNALPVSAAYHAFIRRPTGIIQKLTGIPSFRADVSGPIDQGDSWQLAMLIAHRLQYNDIFRTPHDADGNMHIIWASGQVDINQNVTPIQHIREKILASKALFDDIKSQDGQIHLVLHPDNIEECKDIIPAHAICHSVSVAKDIDNLLSDNRLQPVLTDKDLNKNITQQQRSIFYPIHKIFNNSWKRRLIGYVFTIICVISIQQMIPWHPIYAAMEMEKSGEHVKLIRMLKSYRQADSIMSRLSFLYLEEAYLQQKSVQLIAQLDMQLVWAVSEDGSSTCDNSQMRWHQYEIKDKNLPFLPRKLCHLYLEIKNSGTDKIALAVAINLLDDNDVIPVLQPAQAELAPTEHIRHPIKISDDKPLMIMVSSSDHLSMNWYQWFKRWANRPSSIIPKNSLQDTGIGVHMAIQNND